MSENFNIKKQAMILTTIPLQFQQIKLLYFNYEPI